MLLSSLVLALLVNAATPKSTTPSPADKATTEKASSSNKSSPAAAKPGDSDLAVPMEESAAPAAVGTPTPASGGPIQKPVLYMMSQEHYAANGKNWVRYRYDVLNKASYPLEMFAAAPALPPCGLNTNASRTWVDFFDSTGRRLYGFCALGKPDDLGKIWFALEEGVVPPSYVYIELNDRQTNTKYKSNLADTTL